ncbi:MAG: hypothetical protein IH600_01215 [Bacteroidetes bacterium]|nr:hypothetical protein [Bacteroidota bacterium]
MKRAITILLLLLLGAGHVQARYNDINYALTISNGACISVPNHNSLNNQLVLGLRFTIDAWVKPTTLGSEMAIVGNGFAYWFGLDATGKLCLKLNGKQIFLGQASISTSNWTHVAVVVDIPQGFVRFFVNGALDKNIAHTGSMSGNTGPLYIGADMNPTGGPAVITPWNGAIDEVRIWNMSLDFPSALGALHRTAHAIHWGLYGQYLVSAWRLNGGALDHCGGNHGTLVGACSFITSPLPPFYERIGLGFMNNLATGGGFSVATVAHSSTLNLTTNYTVEFWMKPSSQNGNSSFQTLVCKGDGIAGIMSFWIGLNKSNGKIRFAPYGNFTTTFESTTTIPLNQWSHVAVSFGPAPQGGYQSLIVINGQIAGLATASQPTPSNTQGLLIGAGATAAAASNAYGYSGLIDELRIWNVARSYDEIADNHRIEIDTPQSGLVALYHFDGTIWDYSGNLNHSTDLVPTSLGYFISTTDLPGPPSLTITEPVSSTVWRVGQSGRIRYQAVGLPWLRLELSRDGGATYPDTLIKAADGPSGEFIWPVEGPISTQCRVRAATVTPTSIADESDIFTIEEELPYLYVEPRHVQIVVQKGAPIPAAVPLHIMNTGGGALQWTITTSNPAWLSIASLGGSGNDQNVDLTVTTTNMFAGEYTETLIVNSNATNGPIFVLVTYRVTEKKVWTIAGKVISDDGTAQVPIPYIRVEAEGDSPTSAETDADGNYTLDLSEGDWTVAPRSVYFTFTPQQRDYPQLSNNDFAANFNAEPAEAWVTLHFHEGWNLISIPIAMMDQEISSVLPYVLPPAYIFDPDSGYLPRTRISSRTAYWVHFSQADSVRLFGTLFRYSGADITTKVTGWRMVATPSGDVNVLDIEQTPSNILAYVYEYDPQSGYVQPNGNILRSGKSYFMKVVRDGTVLLRAMEPEESRPPPALLRFPGAAIDSGDDMPPPPPGGFAKPVTK